ncbi:MAG: SH3 domain-containing protein [Propioniciclava sp.]|uniref:SH3 domain-containing protein n=1 Tax=Propioniciclava sp. TaxID=2038686 RepID=UPI0039E35F21
MAATTWVNMRSGPGTGHGVLTVLAPSQAVTTTGQTSGGWYQVTTTSGQTGWVSKTYLKSTGTSSGSSASSSPTASGSATTIAAVNVRSGPGTGHTVLGVAAKGTTLPTTGKTSGGWTEVIRNGSAAWISTSYLTRGAASGSSAPVSGQVRTTANLYLRVGGSIKHAADGVLPAYSVVDTTGATSGDYTEIIHQGERRWIATRYLSATTSGPSVPSTPAVTGSVWVDVESLYVRATSSPNSAVVATLRRGTELKTTGVVAGDRLQVIYNGAARWVFRAYTTSTAPGVSSSPPTASLTPMNTSVSLPGYSGLKNNAKVAAQHVIDSYPAIRTIGGWRSGSAYSSDHPNGRAIDVMVPNWGSSTGVDLGDKIAADFQANAAKYNVSYIIWRQQQWNAAYPQRGWRWMENRGSVTQNHYDHVHVSFKS